MTQPDFPSLLASINRCNAVYDPDDPTARRHFNELGCTVLGRYCDAGHQAVAHRDPQGWATLTLCGTRIAEGSMYEHAIDLFEDIDFTPCEVAAGIKVAAGAFSGLGAVFAWALALFRPNEAIRVEGHSLGGQRSHLAPLFVPVSRLDRLVAWEPPKAGSDSYYAAHAAWFTRAITVINGADPWAAWPWTCRELLHPPGPILWLRNDRWQWTTRESWPGGEILHAPEHDTDQIARVVQSLIL